MAGLSLQARLLAGMAVIALVLTAVAVVITTTTRDDLLRQVDERLEGFAEGPRGGFPDDFDPDRIPIPPPGPEPDADAEGYDGDGDGFPRISEVYSGLIDPATGEQRTMSEPTVDDGVPVVTLDDLEGLGPDDKAELVFNAPADDGSGDYRVVARRLGDQVFVVGVSLDEFDATMERLILVEVLGLLAVLAVLGAVAWWVVRLGIRPIKQMTLTASEISAASVEDLAQRLPAGSVHTESGQLALALNAMLGRIESAVGERARSEDRLRRFVADASHELRTPITTIRGYAELYRHGGLAATPDLDDAMRRTEQEAQRMGRLVEDLLTLAKLDQHRALDTRRVDLGALMVDAARDTAVVAPERAVAADVDEQADLSVVGDADRLRQVVANVVGNALVHTPATSAVTLRARPVPAPPGADGGAAVVIEVADEGPGMTAEVAARVTERFYRADPSRARHAGGTGLGMAIVDAIVAAHGGTVAIDTAPERGTTVTIALPVAGPLPPAATAQTSAPTSAST